MYVSVPIAVAMLVYAVLGLRIVSKGARCQPHRLALNSLGVHLCPGRGGCDAHGGFGGCYPTLPPGPTAGLLAMHTPRADLQADWISSSLPRQSLIMVSVWILYQAYELYK